MVESPAQFGRMRALIHRGPIPGGHVTMTSPYASLRPVHRRESLFYFIFSVSLALLYAGPRTVLGSIAVRYPYVFLPLYWGL